MHGFHWIHSVCPFCALQFVYHVQYYFLEKCYFIKKNPSSYWDSNILQLQLSSASWFCWMHNANQQLLCGSLPLKAWKALFGCLKCFKCCPVGRIKSFSPWGWKTFSWKPGKVTSQNLQSFWNISKPIPMKRWPLSEYHIKPSSDSSSLKTFIQIQIDAIRNSKHKEGFIEIRKTYPDKLG